MWGDSSKRHIDYFVVHKPGQITIAQLHENSHLSQHGHFPHCPKYVGKEAKFNKETTETDEFNIAYTQSMALATGLDISYRVFSECCMLHGSMPQLRGPEYVFRPPWVDTGLTRKALMDSIINDPAEFNGFVVSIHKRDVCLVVNCHFMSR